MYGEMPKRPVLMVNNWLRELAIEYGIKDYIIRSACPERGIYTAYLRWHHSAKGEMATLAVSVTLKVLGAEPWMDFYSQAISVMNMKKQRCRQSLVDIIMECGSVQ